MRNTAQEKQQTNSNKYRMPEKMLNKYNVPTCSKAKFTASSLDLLKTEYHNSVRGLPGFVHRFLKGEPSRHRDGVVNASKLYPVMKDNKIESLTLLLPNPSYHPHIIDVNKIRDLKNQPAGFGLVSWFIYPTLFNAYLKKEKENTNSKELSVLIQHIKELATEKLKAYPQWLRYGANNPKNLKGSFSSLPRTNSQECIKNIEDHDQYTQPYLASILDLDHDPQFSVYYLKKLKKFVWNHVETIYGINKSDQVNLYFHFPYADSTTTLHLHVRVNQKAHGLEMGRCFMIDDIINQLENNKTVKDLILNKNNGVSYNESFTAVPGINKITVEDNIENPYWDRDLRVWNLEAGIDYFFKTKKSDPKRIRPNWLSKEISALLSTSSFKSQAENLSYNQLEQLLDAICNITNNGTIRPSQAALVHIIKNNLEKIKNSNKNPKSDKIFSYTTSSPTMAPVLIKPPAPIMSAEDQKLIVNTEIKNTNDTITIKI